jgi:type IV pilus secretin PilQ/predicted competence protein
MKTYWRALQPSRLILMSAVLVPLGASAQTTPTIVSQAATVGSVAQAPASAVAQVEVSHSSQQTTVRVVGSGGSGPLNYHILRLSDPSRVVLDFDNTRLSALPNAIPSSYAPVRGVRLGQSRPDALRLVIDLDYPASYSVDNGEQTLSLHFADSATAVATTGSTVVSTQPAPKASATKEPVSVSPKTTEPRQFPLPVTLTDSKAVLASPLPQAVSPVSSVVPAPADPSAASRLNASSPAAQQPQGAPPGGYTGEPISVNLKDVDLKDFFRLIHEISGLNVVLDPAVRGTVTLVLDEVPWDQALEIVLSNNSLAKEINGNVLRIATRDTLKREAQDKTGLVKAQSDAVEPVTTTRVLSYAKASDVRDVVKRFLSPRGDIYSDDRSNTLIIRDIPTSIPTMDNLIRQLDRKTQQVQIEARVVSASRSFARDIGSQFAFSSLSNNGNSIYGGATAVGTSPITSLVAPPLTATTGSTAMPLVTNFPANAPTSGFSFSNRSGNFALDYIITAAESKGVGKLLSSPQLVTQNNAKATVKQGTEVPIQTTVNNTVSVQYVDAVLQLQVTPQITADGTIFMDVLVENTSIDNGIPLVQGIPALDTQSAQTKVLINDGGTVVIGGVMISQSNTNVNQVPLVGSIPLIGHLFRETSVSVSSQELLFFLTPRILPG